MKNKEIQVVIPEGYEIDRENSTFECIKFKPKSLTYDDIAKALFKNKDVWYIDDSGSVSSYDPYETFDNPNNCVSKLQAKKLLAFNRLINVAKYLNGDWKPDFNDSKEMKYAIALCKNDIVIDKFFNYNNSTPCFKSEELAKQAIDILGEETIKLAFAQV